MPRTGYYKTKLEISMFRIGGFNTLIYISAHHTSTLHIALISSTAPIIGLIIAGVFKIERLSNNKILGAICAFIGSIIVIAHGDISNIFTQKWNPGDILLIFSSLIWGIWNVAMRLKPKGLSARSLLSTLMAVGSLWLLPFYIWEVIYVAPTPLTLEAWYSYLYVSIFASVIAWFLWNYSIDTIGAIKTSLIYYSIPIFSGMLAIVLLNEPIMTYQIIGFLLVFGGIVISNFSWVSFKIRR